MTVHTFPAAVEEHCCSLPLSFAPQPFPKDAHAVIYRPARSVMTSGKARTREWKLRFDRRTPPMIEPLMGWTEADDTLPQVELSFPSAEAAIAYARRQGLQYTVQGGQSRKPDIRIVSATTQAEQAAATARRQRLEWVERTLGPDVIRQGFAPGTDPAALYADPQDVLHNSHLNTEQKRDLLQRWALDAYLLDLEFSGGSSNDQASRLQEVIDALIDLDGRPTRKGERDNKRDNSARSAA
jgi:hypothetical protein